MKVIFRFFKINSLILYRKEILSDVSFTVMPGQTFALVKLNLNFTLMNIVFYK